MLTVLVVVVAVGLLAVIVMLTTISGALHAIAGASRDLVEHEKAVAEEGDEEMADEDRELPVWAREPVSRAMRIMEDLLTVVTEQGRRIATMEEQIRRKETPRSAPIQREGHESPPEAGNQ